MDSKNFENLVKMGMLKPESTNNEEVAGLIHSGRARLKDASLEFLSEESRFDLAYNAAHSIALAALRLKGYRANNRYVVFQALPFTLGVGPEVWRILSKCHDKRNLAEYEGHCEMDTRLLNELISAAHILLEQISPLLKGII